MRFGELTYEEIRERANAACLAVVPTGCTEQQGPHLPVDFDTWFAETVCLAAADRAATQHDVHALVLPALPFGPTPEHRNFGSGYVDLPQPLHEEVVSAVLESLADQGFRRIVVWRGCGQHDLSGPVARFNAAHAGEARAFQPKHPYHDIWCRIGEANVPGGHADSFATSIALHLRPQSVRVDKITDPKHPPVNWDDPDLDFAAYSSTGVIGDPTHASAELGAKLWEAVVQDAAVTLSDIAGARV
ncbi:MAG TPA: creatininase family protein [Planctomycetota bacterium]|nr:creatininase family protein [Planctomycetota bacterium]